MAVAAEDYGSGPFFAAGEEKTIGPWPRGYGMPIKATDQWLLLYMVHSAVSKPMETYITYEIDFVPKADARGDRDQARRTRCGSTCGPPATRSSTSSASSAARDDECTWPKEKCADFDPFGKKFVGQGEPGNGIGEDFKLPEGAASRSARSRSSPAARSSASAGTCTPAA